MPVITQGDARAVDLPDESVDLIVTSPPYFGLRDYGTAGQLGAEATPAEFIAALVECTREMMRVLKPFGSIFVNLGDKYANPSIPGNRTSLPQGGRPGQKPSEGHRSAKQVRRAKVPMGDVRPKSLMLLPERYRIACTDELGLIARAVLVWSKPNGLPESVTDRVRRSHEDWVHLTKQPKYFAAVDEIREPHTQRTHDQAAIDARRLARGGVKPHLRNEHDLTGDRRAAMTTPPNPLGKLPGSVWEIATQPLRVPAELGVDHFAAFPMEWPRRLVLGWSPPDGVVLDPFSGTGTTALVATMLGRTGIGVDLSADYCRLAQWRAADPKERARAAGLDPDAVAKVVPSIPGQTELFGEAS